MNRKILWIIALLLIPMISVARPISKAEAFRTATSVLNQSRPGRATLAPFALSEKIQAKTGKELAAPAYYAFNDADHHGFVIVSGDDQLPPLVAYSDKGVLSDEGTMPQGVVDFLDAYTRLVEAVRAGTMEAPKRPYSGEITGREAVSPLLTCTWSQDSPYNYYCPNKYPVGCVATAMSQIMYFWKYPAHSKGRISYQSSQGYINIDFDASGDYDWSLMRDAHSSVDWKRDSGKMVAKLCYHAGASCRMSYASGGSGSYIPDALDGLVTTFGFDGESLTLYIRDCMSQNEWNRLLYSELRAGRPVLYAGSSPSGGGSDSGGHAFVFDGYDTNAFVHVNWGWGGSYDGYYDINLLDCANYRFTDSQQMITGIIPDPDGLHTKRKQFPMRMYAAFQRTSSDPIPVTDEFKFNLKEIYNISPYGTAFTIGIGLFDTQGNLLQNLNVNDAENIVSLGSKYGYREYGPINCKLKSVPADGDYIFSVITKENGFSDFVLPFTNGGDKANRVHAYIHDGMIYFNQTSPSYVEPTEEPFEIDLTPAALPGDVNGDGNVDINDVVCIINHMAGTTLYDAADVNGDKEVNINDVVAVINHMASLTP